MLPPRLRGLQGVLVEECEELEAGFGFDEIKEAAEAFKGKRKPDFSRFT